MGIMDLFGLDADALKFLELEMKYRNFYAPAFEVLVEGENIQKQGVEVTNVRVGDAINAAGDFSFTVNNAFDVEKKDFKWMDEFFSMGKKVTVKMGYTDDMELMLTGLISSISADFPSGGLPELQIGGKDCLEFMMKSNQPGIWKEATHSDVVKDIINKKYKDKFDISDFDIGDTKVKYDIVSQKNKNDFKFISELAEENCFEFFLLGDTFYFKERSLNGEPVVILEWGKNLVSFSPQANLSEQVGSVKVTGWDARNKNTYSGKAPKFSTAKMPGAKNGSQLAKSIYGSNSTIHKQIPVISQEDADRKASSIYGKNAGKLLTGRGESIGIPLIRSGRHIKLKGLGKLFNKSYYIVSTEHTVSASGYQTSFNVEVDYI